jgi:hypothetical protein
LVAWDEDDRARRVLLMLERETGPAPQSKPRRGYPNLHDEQLGVLRWDDQGDAYVAELPVGGQVCELSIGCPPGPDLDRLLLDVRRFLAGDWAGRLIADARRHLDEETSGLPNSGQAELWIESCTFGETDGVVVFVAIGGAGPAAGHVVICEYDEAGVLRSAHIAG